MTVVIRLRYLVLTALVLIGVQAATIPVAISLAQQTSQQQPRANTPLGDSFTYQGRLTSADLPAEGSYDFEFRLFDQATGGTQVGPTIPADGVAVSNGLFSVALDFGAEAFDGSQRFIEVRARPSSGGTFATVGQRQELTATPYALYAKNVPEHDHAGAIWTLNANNRDVLKLEQSNTSNALNAVNLSSGNAIIASSALGTAIQASGGTTGVRGHGPVAGVIGESYVDTGVMGRGPQVGVHGESNAPQGTGVRGDGLTGVSGVGNTGVHGEVTGGGSAGVVGDGKAFANGVVGYSTATDYGATYGKNDNGYGVVGDSASSGRSGVLGRNYSGYGVWGQGSTGVHGTTSAPGGVGVDGRSTAGDGVFGLSSTNGYAGVHGQHSTWNGVYGEATTSGTGVAGTSYSGNGIYGSSVTGFAGNFQGKLWVTGIVDAPSGELKAVSIKPDLNNFRNLGFAGLAWKQVVAYSYPGPSDARLKHDVVDLQLGLAEIERLRPVSFAWNDSDRQDMGLIAQEVREVLPGIVAEGEDEAHTLTVDYTRIIPVLIRAIQEQQEQIDELRTAARIDDSTCE